MFESLNNPFIIIGGILAAGAIVAVICKAIAMVWRILHIKPNQHTKSKLEEMGIFNNHHRG